MRRAVLALAAALAGPQLAAGDEPVCFAPADACGTTAIGMLLDASKSYTAPEATAMRAAVADINADLNVLPHTQLVLREENISEFARIVETYGSDAAGAEQAAAEPNAAATCKGVRRRGSLIFTFAPRAHSRRTQAAWPPCAAKNKGVHAESGSRRWTSDSPCRSSM